MITTRGGKSVPTITPVSPYPDEVPSLAVNLLMQSSLSPYVYMTRHMKEATSKAHVYV